MNALLQTRRQSLALIAAGLAVPGAAWATEAPSPIEPGLPEAQFTPDDGLTDLMSMEDMLRRMTAPVMINGKGPFDFVVDTGTNRSAISDDLAAALNLPAGPIVHLHGIGGERDGPTAKLDRFQVGVREARRLNLPILPARSLRGAGILGVDGLKKQRVVLDLRNQRLRIEPSNSHNDSGLDATMVKARRRFGQLTVVDTDFEGLQVSVMIDTGAEVTVGNLALQAALALRRKARPVELQPVTLTGATGEMMPGVSGGVPVFRMGALRVSNLRVVYADLHPFQMWDLNDKPAMLMGMDVIRFFDLVSLDYGRNEMRFVLPTHPFIDPAGEPRRS